LVFIGSCAGTFYGLDKQTGQVRWSYDIHKDGDQTSFHGNPLITEDRVIIGTDGDGIGHVYAFDKRTGKLIWKYPITRGFRNRYGVSTDIVRAGSNVYGVTLVDELLCLDLESGRLNWSFQKPYVGPDKDTWYWPSSPTVAGSRVYFGAINGSMYAIDGRSGKLLWRRDLSARVSASPIVIDDSVYVGTADHHLYRLKQSNGDVVAKLEVETIPVGPLVTAGHSLLTILNPGGGPGGSQVLACIDPSLSKVLWSQRPSKDWSMRQPLVWNNTVLAGNEAGELFAYRLADGRPQWSHPFKGTIRSIGNSGEVLYIGTLGGTVYAYAPEKASEGVAGPIQGPNPLPSEIKDLRTELEKMLDEDQKLRAQSEAIEEKYGPDSKELRALWAEQEAVDKKFLRRLEEIIQRYGWPGVRLVGSEASLAAFLILQHADYEYQKK
jgi:hypothetical protein